MTSTHIYTYTSEKVLPYVYLCTHKITGEFYIGSRFTKTLRLPSHLDFPRYKTSSKLVKPRFDEFNWIILSEFFDAEDAYWEEQLLIGANWDNPLCLNQSKADINRRLSFKNPGGNTYTHSDASKEKMRSASAARTHGIDTKERMKTARKIENGNDVIWRLVFNGVDIQTTKLTRWCKDNRLNYYSLKDNKYPHCRILGKVEFPKWRITFVSTGSVSEVHSLKRWCKENEFNYPCAYNHAKIATPYKGYMISKI